MYSNWSESSQRQPHGDRRWRQWDHHDRRQPHNQYEGDRRRSREYSESPPRPYGRDSASRWSPARRRASSPSPEETRRRVAGDDGSDYRYRAEPWDNAYKRPPPADVYGRTHASEDPTDAPKYRDSPELGRRYRQDDARRDDATYRRERGGRRRSWERSRSRERPSKSYGGCSERAGSPPASGGQEERRLHAAEFSLNGSSEQVHRPSRDGAGAAKPEAKRAEGFQRFLDILNKGVNMDTLSRIVATTPGAGQQGCPPQPAVKAAGGPSPGRENDRKERGERHRLTPPPRRCRRHRRSLSPTFAASQRRGSLGGRSASPPAAAAPPPAPEDEHKRRQMQDVLQAIGLDLGLDELGQMSHRIQERLYGRRDGEPERRRRAEGASRPRRSRSSSSSSSSVSPERSGRRDSSGAETDDSELQLGRRSADKEYHDCDYRLTTAAAAAAAAAQLSPPVVTYAPSAPPPAHAMPQYSPVPYPPPPPVFPHVPPVPFTPHLPPPAAHFPHMPPPSAFPPRLPFPPPAINPQLQPLNAAAPAKAEPRRRCLKVIQTKPG